MYHGIVLTSAPTAEYVKRTLLRGRYNSLKVVSGKDWGIGGESWTQAHRVLVAASTKHLVVRSRYGDGLGNDPFPNWENILEEFRPWYQAVIKGRTTLVLEIGNEPDNNLLTDPAGYAWHLVRAVSACRAAFPDCEIISPALSDKGFTYWMRNEEFKGAIELCDYIGVHRYAHSSLFNDDTGHGALIRAIKSRKPKALTEMGINNAALPKAEKIRLYRQFVAKIPASYAMVYDYHLCTSPINVDQHNYALTLADFG